MSLTHQITHSPDHSLTRSLTHYVTHLLCHSLTMSLTYYVTHLLCHSLTMSLTHYVTHSLTMSLTHSLCHSLTHYVTHSLTMSLTRTLLYFFTDQYGKIDTYQHKQSSVSNLYPYSHTSTPYSNSHTVSKSEAVSERVSGNEDDAREFLSKFATASKPHPHYCTPSPASEFFLQPHSHTHSHVYEPPRSPEYRHSVNISGNSHTHTHSHSQSQFNLTPPVDPFDSLISKSATYSQHSHTQSHTRGRVPESSSEEYSSPQSHSLPPHQQAEELLQRFQKLTHSHTHESPAVMDSDSVAPERVSDAEVVVMQSELARTCKRENGTCVCGVCICVVSE
jgi:hypothetical protein